ncbi:MATE family efflux transporter [Carboxylicivirga sp. M1479]|uniref:MATE family efflux transporter n=1 Tax=Carboxylicivirga sp. M1479 TaxID=2594476 RepID=UPI001178CB56|nr:MATE family efflux transporter [Carboxylicivirga sp. M1479]TRX65802.1 MATE family efflux transporter [Carboxylicivirga sp. M1479]
MQNKYSAHYWPNIKLATPVVLAQAGQMLVNVADTVMVGQVGTIPLAAASLANSIFINVMVLGMGISFALTPLVGKAFGAKNKEDCAYWFQQGLYANAIIGVLLSLLAGAIVLIMPYMGQETAVVEEAIPYYILLVLSILPLQLFNNYKQFAEGLSNTKVAMIITIGGNVLNIALNYVFIYGHFGAPALGVVGAGIGTLVSRILMAVTFMIVSRQISLFNNYRGIHLSKFSMSAFRRIWKLGLPIGLQSVIEVFAFSLGSIMMGWINAVSMAAHQIVLSMASLTYMMSSGLGSATTIKVSIFRGKKEYPSIKDSAFASLHLVVLFMTIMGILFVSLRYFLPSLFVDELDVIETAAGLMLVAGLFQIFDGIQVVALGILRGLEDVVMPVIGAGIAYWVISLPIGYLTAFTFDAGPVGIWIGYLAGLSSAGVFLLWRFRSLYKKRYGK